MSEHLQNIIERADQSLVAIQAAVGLIKTTYGAGCVDHGGSHPDELSVQQSARVLIVQLQMLKYRAVALMAREECGEETRRKMGVIL